MITNTKDDLHGAVDCVNGNESVDEISDNSFSLSSCVSSETALYLQPGGDLNIVKKKDK